MPTWLSKYVNSRKFVVFISTFLTLLGAALSDGIVTEQEAGSLVTLAIGYIASVALEDGMTMFKSQTNENTTTVINTPPNITTTPDIVLLKEGDK